jgi:uncharacterized protein YxjI
MHTAFQFKQYILQRKVLALTGKFNFYGPQGQTILYSEQRMFKLKEDVRVYSGPDKSQELLRIKARQVIDFSAAYDVLDPMEKVNVGTLQRRGLRSIARDEWQILDTNQQPVGIIIEDDLTYAMLRRFLLGSLLPQNYDVLIDGNKVADLQQKFNLIRYEMLIDFTSNKSQLFDPRLGIAAALLLGIIEGKQSN